MKLDSPLFDRIRVKPKQDRRPAATAPVCEWAGCDRPAEHRAPKGRFQEGQYWCYCLDHVREYNHAYNYFAGMPDDAVAAYQKDALTGHRPTWRMGANGAPTRDTPEADGPAGAGWRDPFGIFGEMGGTARPDEPVRERVVRNAERKALESLGLEGTSSKEEIKARFKQLVKKFHPDVNGGDPSTEDRLRDVIQAYNYLKSAGFC